MGTLIVRAPHPVTEKFAGVTFVDGVATVDEVADRRAVAYFRRRGYQIDTPQEPEAQASPRMTARAAAGKKETEK